MDELTIALHDLVENPSPRVPVCLVLDTSGSMNGAPINELNQGIRMFFESILEDEVARYSVEVAIVTFGERVEQLTDFGDIEKQTPPTLRAGGYTPMGAAVTTALELLENRKRMYQSAGVDYHQPWLVLMTDGEPTDDISYAAEQCSKMINNKKLTIFPIGIGSHANLNTMAAFSPKRPPVRLQGLKFKEFFEWLSKSTSTASSSTPGETIIAPDASAWMTLD